MQKQNEAKQVEVRQIRSEIGQTERQRRTLAALGLRGIGSSMKHNATDSTMGMVKSVAHLVTVAPIVTVNSVVSVTNAAT